MKEDESEDNVPIGPQKLPNGEKIEKGTPVSIADIGSDGTLKVTLPLPVSEGRGYAPSLQLQYSGGGNGVFGKGWHLPIMRIIRRTDRGVPFFDERDEFLGPDGDVLQPERNNRGEVVIRIMNGLGQFTSQSYQVTRYFPRVERNFDRIEHWSIQGKEPFWLVYDRDGQVHCLGKTEQGRVAMLIDGNTCVAEWLLEESVSPQGEHIIYFYQQENAANVTLGGVELNHQRSALRYLNKICYGNILPSQELFLWNTEQPLLYTEWLFQAVFDYGERGLDPFLIPAYRSTDSWLARLDPFSQYHYGFELRCHRLCRQMLMYHNFPELSEFGEVPYLVSRFIFTYDESAISSLLTSVRHWAYESDKSVLSFPPVIFSYNAFPSAFNRERWCPWEGPPGSSTESYQWIDLFGEGVSGQLFQSQESWYYREPQRDISKEKDSVSYAPWQPVDLLPSLGGNQPLLVDCNRDGSLECLVNRPGLQGFFKMCPDKTWSDFQLFSALPSEFFHHQIRWVDLMGAGLPDLVLIDSQKVRLYANKRTGFAQALEVVQDPGVELPLPGRDERALVTFSDVLGSGQSHLIELRYNCLRCWPNLGRGRFGLPVTIGPLNFDFETFDPKRVMLADLTGSGAADIVYFDSDVLKVYLNQSGNSFSEPIILPLPEGIYYDRFCELFLDDVQGRSVASLILSTSHVTPMCWRFDLFDDKPYLLSGINNNLGLDYHFSYRNSVQFWLDEKRSKPDLLSYNPFPIHVISEVITYDEITRNSLSQAYAFYQGVYDGKEREFRGFAKVEAQLRESRAEKEKADVLLSEPLLTYTWYHTGRKEDAALPVERWKGDPEAFSLLEERLTAWDSIAEADSLLSDEQLAQDDAYWWMLRALQGSIMRQEIYGQGVSDGTRTIYRVTDLRYQIRLCQPGTVPVVLSMLLEQLDYQYDGISIDPQCSHKVVLSYDAYAQATRQVVINYPRRVQPSASPYPSTLPVGSVASSYDEQQNILRLEEQRSRYYNIIGPTVWCLSLPWQVRLDVLNFSAEPQSRWICREGLNFEKLIQDDGLLSHDKPRVFAGQKQIFYNKQPFLSLPALVDHEEVAEFDDKAIKAYTEGFTEEGYASPDHLILDSNVLEGILEQAKYVPSEKILCLDKEVPEKIWSISKKFTCYNGINYFYLPEKQRETLLTGWTTIKYNDYQLAKEIVDPLGNSRSTLAWDYRFLYPRHNRDINNNDHYVAFNALGSVVAEWFMGTERRLNGPIKVGFPSPIDKDICAATGKELLERPLTGSPLTVACRWAHELFSWMGKIDEVLLKAVANNLFFLKTMLKKGLLVPDPVEQAAYRITNKGYSWIGSEEGLLDLSQEKLLLLRRLLKDAERLPPYYVKLRPDRYPDEGLYTDGLQQQTQVSVKYSDGLRRELHEIIQDESGIAWIYNAKGELLADKNKLLEKVTNTRWNVRQREEYSIIGNKICSYQPYFVNDWRYVNDQVLRERGYTDVFFYDGLKRETFVKTAKGYLRRNTYYPWFSVSEDENDTIEQNV